MWLLWAVLALAHSVGGPGPPSCPWEPFAGLVAVMEDLGSRNDGTLYTPDSLSVCPKEVLHCFVLELSVIGYEEGPLTGRTVNRLKRSLEQLATHLWGPRGGAASGPCPLCEGHPERPVPQFLAKLLELLQVACAGAHRAG
ncbi:uncharacterized protein ACOB8E_018593 isoform 1-T2 [Sarcophilus harrisii]|uniref:Interleukin n=1 Tax=Sarcophilus harrisii TaxID=9305 RepID=A0A7N4P9I0_SARHA